MMSKEKAQISIEVAIVIFVMQGYFKRALQGRMRAVADNIGEQYSFENTDSMINMRMQTNTIINTTTEETNGTTRTTSISYSNETQTQSGYEHVYGW
jgi:hypothetical protein